MERDGVSRDAQRTPAIPLSSDSSFFGQDKIKKKGQMSAGQEDDIGH